MPEGEEVKKFGKALKHSKNTKNSKEREKSNIELGKTQKLMEKRWIHHLIQEKMKKLYKYRRDKTFIGSKFLSVFEID